MYFVIKSLVEGEEEEKEAISNYSKHSSSIPNPYKFLFMINIFDWLIFMATLDRSVNYLPH